MSKWIKVNNKYKDGSRPVDNCVYVNVKDRSGQIKTNVQAGDILWYNSYSGFDIVEYQVVFDPKEKLKESFQIIKDRFDSLEDNQVMIINDNIVNKIDIIEEGFRMIANTSSLYSFDSRGLSLRNHDPAQLVIDNFKVYRLED